MALIVTQDTLPDLEQLPGAEGRFARHQAYCALDCCAPLDIFAVLHPRLDEDTERIYRFEHACLKPALTMQLRGILVDQDVRALLIEKFEKEEFDACQKVADLAVDVWDRSVPRVGRCGDHNQHLWPRGEDPDSAVCKRCGASRLRPEPISATSHSQLARLFYQLWNVRVRCDRKTGKPTTDKEALEGIRGEYAGRRPEIAEAANWALVAAHAQKQAGYCRVRLDRDGRYRFSQNVGAAETGRWSASESPKRTGGNVQQLADEIREMLVPDPGLIFWYADLEQAESNVVAHDSGDPNYIRVHSLSDPHTAVCKLVWPELPWPGGKDWERVSVCGATKHGAKDNSYCCDRGLADSTPRWDPYHSYRDYAKRIQHGGNMGRTPRGVARQIHVSLEVAEEVYARMYGGIVKRRATGAVAKFAGAFPMIKARHRAIAAELKRTGVTTSCFGRRRQFLGRTWDDDTLREALGQLEQSPVADILNLSLCRVWRALDTRVNVHEAPHPSQPNKAWVLAQVHDAILGLCRPGDAATLRRIRDLMTIPFWIEGRLCTLGVEVCVSPTSWKKSHMQKVKFE